MELSFGINNQPGYVFPLEGILTGHIVDTKRNGQGTIVLVHDKEIMPDGLALETYVESVHDQLRTVVDVEPSPLHLGRQG